MAMIAKILPQNSSKSDENVVDPKLAEMKELAESIKSQCKNILQIGCLHFKDAPSYYHDVCCSRTEGRPYVRTNYNVLPEELIHKVLVNHWKMKIPRIVLLVISNIASLKDWSNARQMKNFQKGIMKAADTTNMWIITHGINLGTTSLVGEAVRNEIADIKCSRTKGDPRTNTVINVIGITPEHKLRHSEALAAIKEYKMEVPNESTITEDGKHELSSELTHYIVVKDDTKDKTGVNKFLSSLMQFMSVAQSSAENTEGAVIKQVKTTEIPVVALVIQGGFESLDLVAQQIKNRIPVVVLRGSGGLADLLAFVESETSYRANNVWDIDIVDSYIKPELMNRISSHFPKLNENESLKRAFRDKIIETVTTSKYRGKEYLTVLNMHNAFSTDLTNLTEYLLMALFKSQRTESAYATPKGEDIKPSSKILRDDLYLCLDWNCPEVAKKEVLAKDPSYVLTLEKKMFEEALTRSNRSDFVDLFLLHGFRLRTFINAKILKRMYRKIHGQDFFHTICWEGILNRSNQLKQSSKFIDRELNWLIEAATGLKNYMTEEELGLYVMGNYPGNDSEAERKSLVMIAMWAVFGFRKQLVRVLWKHCDQPVHLAIVIAMMYERLSWYVSEQGLNTELKAESKTFINYAYGVLDQCYKDSPDRAQEVLNELTRDWNFKTPVDMAAMAKQRYFLSHPCCQKWLTTVYYGNISIKDMRCGLFRLPSFVKILLCAFFVFPMYFWVRFKNYEVDQKELEDDVDDDDDEQQASDKSATSSAEPDKKTNIISHNIAAIDREIVIPNQPLPWIMIYEMWNAPVTKFWTSQLFYIIYLSIFSVALLYPACGSTILDAIVCYWNVLIIADLIRRAYLFHSKFSNSNVSSKVIEIMLLIIFLSVYVFGRLLDGYRYTSLTPYKMKVILSFALLYAFYRLFAIYLPISPTLGPLLYRLKIMILVDFLNFMRMTVIAMISFGVVIQTLLYPDMQLSKRMFSLGFTRTFFTLFVTPLDELKEKDDCEKHWRRSSNSEYCYASRYVPSEERQPEGCADTGFWPYVFSIFYFILLKLILMTLLYAIFASSASSLASDTDSIWKFQRYVLVIDFVNRLPLPPPFNTIIYIFYIIRWIYRLLTCYLCRKHSLYSGGVAHILLMDNTEHTQKLLSPEDYIYMRKLATEFYEEQVVRKEEDMRMRAQWETMQSNCEEHEYEKQLLRQLKRKLNEMDKNIQQTNSYLDSIMKKMK